MPKQEREKSELLRAIPSVDRLLRTPSARSLKDSLGAQRLTKLARAVTDELRETLLAEASTDSSSNGDHSREALLQEAARMLERAYHQESSRGLRRVINASGVIIHTNLGRAPLSEAARTAIAGEAARYCTLEYDTETGGRGRRGARVEKLLADLTGAEDALVVNNCAAAALLVLTALAQGGETIVSRGELIEIGGDFRVPDVMAQSGTRLIEVGTTNRTRLADYTQAITENTRLLMRVHPSNYRIVGFTAQPTLADLARAAHEAGLLLYEDAGSGALVNLGQYGLAEEPVIAESISSGADIISFSGDKLLGSAQAGLIVGRLELVERLRKHPLYRALRADKLALAALEATLAAYQRETAFAEVPVLHMLALSAEEIRKRARRFVSKLQKRSSTFRAETIEGESAIGGGSAPNVHPGTSLIALTHESLSPDALDKALRLGLPPVVARISEDKVLLDLRTVTEDEEASLLNALTSIMG
jgi:L-seryl-tRNA(Ser) seleniumtransferase